MRSRRCNYCCYNTEWGTVNEEAHACGSSRPRSHQVRPKAHLDDAAVCKAVSEIGRGLIDADLGGGLIKQRIARRGGGRSGGFRVLLVFRLNNRAAFVDGFAKNELDNMGASELSELRRLAAEILSYDEIAIAKLLAAGEWTEVDGYG